MPAHNMYIISVSTTQDTARVNGPKQAAQRLPNTLSISFKGLRASDLLMSLADELAASAGAACHSSHEATVSSVLQAMQVSSPSLFILLHIDAKMCSLVFSFLFFAPLYDKCLL